MNRMELNKEISTSGCVWGGNERDKDKSGETYLGNSICERNLGVKLNIS